MKVNHHQKFLELRKEYPFFSFDDFKVQLSNNEILITFFFNISDKHFFKPTLRIPINDHFRDENLSVSKLQNIIFHIGMVELVSYWKATCSKKVIIKPFLINEEQIKFWKKIYYNGLGEFFYVNSIDTDENSFMDISCTSESKTIKEKYELSESNIIPVGGGKDSVVTLELLNSAFKDNLGLIVNPRKASMETALNSGLTEERIFKIYRTIDQNLIHLNSLGFLNGHTPFSALLAFTSILAAAITGRKNIALSNESSANESTVEGSDVNHQFSKSYNFEKDFRDYVHEFISDDFNYFSFLRPLNEIQIARLFSDFHPQFASFKSCNAGSKKDTWCCKCPKCLFTFIVLSSFIPMKELVGIYGTNIFEDKEMLFYFDQLIGKEKVKPFECVGTLEEVNAALCLTIQKFYTPAEPLPFLLEYYKTLDNYKQYHQVNEKQFLSQFNHEHFLNKTFEGILKKYI